MNQPNSKEQPHDGRESQLYDEGEAGVPLGRDALLYVIGGSSPYGRVLEPLRDYLRDLLG